MRRLTYKELDDLLASLGVTERMMNLHWLDCYAICVVVKVLTDKGYTWRDLPAFNIKELVTYREKYEAKRGVHA